MARRLRSNREDGWCHVYLRGIERCEVFLDDLDREHFLKLLGAMSERYRVARGGAGLWRQHDGLDWSTAMATARRWRCGPSGATAG
jgi:hypothetical protein